MKVYLSAKIHKATVTEADLNYMGSLTIDEDLMEISEIEEFEKVLVVNNTNGARLETYAIKGKRGSGVICANGAAAHLIEKGHEVIIMSFQYADEPHKPLLLFVDSENKITHYDTNYSPEYTTLSPNSAMR